jgi:neutral ceramidase
VAPSRLLCLVLLAGVFSQASLRRATAAEEALRVGVAEVDITPPVGFLIAGYYHERKATGTRDSLKAKAIVFQGPKEQAALVVCDLTGIATDLSIEVRRRASAKTGIPAKHIVVAATHSHTAPDYTRDLYQHLAAKGKAPDKPRYAAKLIDGIVEAIVKAHEDAKPATLEAGSARQGTAVSFNRRFVMKDGSVKTWMRLDDPNVVRPAGPIDPEIGMVLARAVDGKQPLALLSNFALHLDTVGGTMWSADYPYYIDKAVRKALGKKVVSVFGLGCCGDINHVDPTAKERNKTAFIGKSLGKTIEGKLGELRPLKRQTLRVRHTKVLVPMQKVGAEEAARARPLLLDARGGKKVEFFDLVRAHKAVVLDQLQNKGSRGKAEDSISWGLSHTWAGVGTHLPVEVQAIGLGDEVGIVCLPGEVFVELGLAIKQASPFKTTLIVELSNCVETMYIPTRAAYAGGSYEVTNSALEPGSGEMLVEAAIRLLRDIARENVASEKK